MTDIKLGLKLFLPENSKALKYKISGVIQAYPIAAVEPEACPFRIRDGETYSSSVYVRDTPRGGGRRWGMAEAGGTLTPTRSRTDKQNKPKRTRNVRCTVIQVQYKVGKASGNSRKHAKAPISLDRKARAHMCHIVSKRLAPRVEAVRASTFPNWVRDSGENQQSRR